MPDFKLTLAIGCFTSVLAACGSTDAPPGNGAAGAEHGGASAGAAGRAGALGGASGSVNSAAGASAGGTGGATGGASSGGTGGAAPTVICAPPDDVFSPIAMLSQTGCVDATDPKKPSASAQTYEVNSPLWSDTADKTRAFVLPAGGKIHVRDCSADPSACPNGTQDDGRWEFPVGSVMYKTFAFDGKLVETRLLMHLDATNWVGYSYMWNEAQTDATVADSAGADTMFNTGTRTVPWHYPSQMDCLNCHNNAGGSTLGPETAQMNRVVGDMNQIDKLAAAQVFDTAPTQPYKAALVTPYTSQAGSPTATATVEQKARSYLHANCGFCHRPGGNYANFDFRYDTAFKDMNLCNADAKKGAIANAPGKTKILVPGSPTDSVMWLRMNEPDPLKGRMPQVASFVVDKDGTGVVGDWITSLTACP